MAYNNTYVCTHLTLGKCSCNPTVTDAFGSSSFTKKRELCNKAHVASRKKKFKNDDELWKIKKVLKKSNVRNMSRFMLGRDMTEDFVLPVLGADADDIHKGVYVKIWDVDTKSIHSLIFKRWVSPKAF